eukprot:457033-Amphidinium_carterae.4
MTCCASHCGMTRSPKRSPKSVLNPQTPAAIQSQYIIRKDCPETIRKDWWGLGFLGEAGEAQVQRSR